MFPCVFLAEIEDIMNNKINKIKFHNFLSSLIKI